MYNRKNCRPFGEIRKVSFKLNPFGYAESSVFYEQGNTKVYVCVGLQQGVPKFLKGSGKGWLTTEYFMHPYSSDKQRSTREVFPQGRDFRSVEISRFIGRSFRSVVDLSCLGERTIFVDCDVFQADGGTRTACVNAVTIALKHAEKLWLSNRQIYSSFFKEPLFAISAGIYQGRAMLDLDKDEDNGCDADFNFVMTQNGMIVEVQGTAEAYPVAWHDLEDCKNLAVLGIKQLSSVLLL